MPVRAEDFSEMMAVFADAGQAGAIAVGVSGGPDSMALCRLLCDWAQKHGGRPVIHALTVDHGLRAESTAEAAQVAAVLADWPGVTHTILRWEKDEAIQSRVQERAREARYGLMGAWMDAREVSHLFLAHHRDDQAETVLFRLAKGSGLDGLAGMSARQDFALPGGGGGVLCRPLLGLGKESLVQLCDELSIPYVMDPSNDSASYSRGRMRKSMEVLGLEGLTSERLFVTAGRLGRAKKALDEISFKSFENNLIENNTKEIVLKFSGLKSCPEEIALRVLLLGMGMVCPGEAYGPRLLRVESLLGDLLSDAPFRKRTLGGVVVSRQDKADEIVLALERGRGDVQG
ncbi:MAG: tRNA lysidine(34) synthetase TilS [Alphaproteobacteria bacterium]|nr:tRNA lysidine(34) synthetase TilS [Alphaproteobacteria bacterium]